MQFIQPSSEIYKMFRGSPTPEYPGGEPILVPIRGLYVSGTHTEPVYIDHYTTIVEFTENTPITIVNLENTSVDFNVMDNVHFVGMERTNSTYSVSYSTAKTSENVMDNVHFVGMEKTNTMYSVSKVTDHADNIRPSHCITITAFTQNSALTITEGE